MKGRSRFRSGSWQNSFRLKVHLRRDMLKCCADHLSRLKKPDVDNIVKIVADALNGVAYHDDTQIVSVLAKKVYAASEGLDVIVEEYNG